MMKKKIMSLIMLTVMLVFGLACAGCDPDAIDESGIDLNINEGNEAKSIKLINVSDADAIQRVAVLVLSELPTIYSLPLPVAVGYGFVTGAGSVALIELTVPQDSALYDGPAWTGSGDYYVQAGIERGPYLFFTNGGENPVKAAFDKAEITLDFNKFKAWSPSDGGDPLPTHWYGCAFSESANTSPRNGTHFLLSISYSDAIERISQYLGTNDGTAENLNLTSSLSSNKTNWVIIEEEVINASLYHVRLIQDLNGVRSGVYWNYNPSVPQ
jgi:hypothetical protein